MLKQWSNAQQTISLVTMESSRNLMSENSNDSPESSNSDVGWNIDLNHKSENDNTETSESEDIPALMTTEQEKKQDTISKYTKPLTAVRLFNRKPAQKLRRPKIKTVRGKCELKLRFLQAEMRVHMKRHKTLLTELENKKRFLQKELAHLTEKKTLEENMKKQQEQLTEK